MARRKMTMKKLISLMIFGIFLLSMFTIAMENNAPDTPDTPGTPELTNAKVGVTSDAKVEVTSDAEMQTYVKQFKGKPVEECIKHAREKFPNADITKIKRDCAALRNLARDVNTDYGKEGLTKIKLRISTCVEFLKKNTDVNDPYAECVQIAGKEKNCVDFLKEHNVDDALLKCDKLFVASSKIIKNREYISEKLEDRIPEEKLKRFEYITAHNPSALGTKAKEFIKNLPDDKAEIFLNLPLKEQKKALENRLDLAKLRIKKVTKDDFYRKRVLVQKTVRRWEEQFNNAKERFQKAKQAHAEKTRRWNEAKKNLKDACEDPESDTCKEAEEQAISDAKEFLINNVNLIIDHLDQIKSKVLASDKIDEDRAQEITDDIDNKISALNDTLTDIDNAQTKEEVKDTAKEVNNIWKKSMFKFQAYAAHVLNSRVSFIIKKSERLEDRLYCLSDQIEGNTTDLSDNIEEFSSKIASTKEDYEKAKELYNEIRELRTEDEKDREAIEEKTKEMVELTKSANEKLKSANKQLVEIFKELRTENVDMSQCRESDEVYEVIDESGDNETTS